MLKSQKIYHYKNEIYLATLAILVAQVIYVNVHYNRYTHLTFITTLFVLLFFWVKSISVNKNVKLSRMGTGAVSLSFLIMLGATQLNIFRWVETLIIALLIVESLLYLRILKKLNSSKPTFKPAFLVAISLSFPILIFVVQETELLTIMLTTVLIFITYLLLFYSYNFKGKSILVLLGVCVLVMGQITGAIKQFIGDFPFEYAITTICFYLGRMLFLKSVFDDLMGGNTRYQNKYELLKS